MLTSDVENSSTGQDLPKPLIAHHSIILQSTQGFTSVRKKTEFLDKFSKSIDIFPGFFGTEVNP